MKKFKSTNQKIKEKKLFTFIDGNNDEIRYSRLKNGWIYEVYNLKNEIIFELFIPVSVFIRQEIKPTADELEKYIKNKMDLQKKSIIEKENWYKKEYRIYLSQLGNWAKK